MTKNQILQESELNKNSVCAKFAHTALDDKNYNDDLKELENLIKNNNKK